jgi:tRNA dimethylallyltransferase
MTMKTISSLQDEKLLDRLYLLDSTDIQRWNAEVLEKGVELTRQFLADEPLPPPAELSEAARDVLAGSVERTNRVDTPCRKTCDVCRKTLLTEELWEAHMASRKHQKAVRGAKKRQLIPAHAIPSRAVVVVEPSSSDDLTPAINSL